MIRLRPANERGHADHGWLKTFHTFSFATYYDPKEVGYSRLRVINDDTVAPGAGFGTHAHRDMEIVTIVLAGVLEHRDSMGNTAQVRPGEVQRMTAGTGVQHSEYNPSSTDPVHFLQIWIEPEEVRLPPSYEQKAFPEAELRGALRLLASTDGRTGSVTIHQDVEIYRTHLSGGEAVTYRPAETRRTFVHVVSGEARLRSDGPILSDGSGARIEAEPEIRLVAGAHADVLVFNLP